jgi:hypothetical protein
MNMAQIPVDILTAGDLPMHHLVQAVTIANTLQDEFRYTLLPESELEDFRVLAFGRAYAYELLDHLSQIRARTKGYHPFVIAFVDAYLDGRDAGNLFGDDRPDDGLAIFTTCNVPVVIIPPTKLAAYFLYYLAKASLNFVVPQKKNHEDGRGCPYDRKMDKEELIDSMRARALCDECRRFILADTALSARQLIAAERMFAACGTLLIDGPDDRDKVDSRPRVFVGSSVEGLPIARALKARLRDDLAITLWDEDSVFGLGDSTLEALERAVSAYQFGLFVFTPDDELHTRGEIRAVARDNVLFELGLFIGKLTRRRAFAVQPSKRRIVMASDLAGIMTAQYDPDEPDLNTALAAACRHIRLAVTRALAPIEGA